MKGVRSLVGVLLVLVALGTVAEMVTATMSTTNEDLQETVGDSSISVKVLNTVSELSSDNCSLYIVNENFLKCASAVELYNTLAKRMESRGFVVVLYKVDRDEKRKFFEAWMKALTKAGYKMSIIPISEVSKDKRSFRIDKRVLNADIVALSVKPFGIFVIEKTTDLASDLKLIARAFNEEKSVKVSSTNIENFDYIGYIGWKSKTVDDVGKEAVKVDYYIAKTTVGGKTYRFFLANLQHSAIGYNGYSPKKFTSITDWNTDIWEGQVLHDWGPKNEGSNTQITFTLTAGTATATISYSVQGGLEIKWTDRTVPDDGYVKTLHGIPNSKSDVTYTLEPSSIGLLDPNKEEGFLPMVVDHEFKTEFQKQILWWTDTKTIDISFTVALYDSNVAEW